MKKNQQKNIQQGLFFGALLFSLWSFIGCHKNPPPVTELNDAHEKLNQLLINESSINPVIKTFPNTLILYVPVDFELFETRAARTDTMSETKPSQKRQINFLETSFEGKTINIQYDIALVNSYPKFLGYTSAYTDAFSRLHNKILFAISRSYSDLENDRHPPDFFQMLIVDIKNGVGIKNIFYLKDLLRVMTNTLPQEEYIKRYITEMIGDTKLINNTTGRGLDVEEITWPEFIAKQITHRINFKYTRSSFPPTKSNEDEILAAVQAAIQAYDFKDVKGIELTDLKNGDRHSFPIEK